MKDPVKNLYRCSHQLTKAVESLEGLASSLPDSIDNELLTGEQVGNMIAVVAYSVLQTQRKLVRTLEIIRIND